VRSDRRVGECERGDAERDVEAADEGGRGELEDRAREPPAPLLARPLVDLVGLRSGDRWTLPREVRLPREGDAQRHAFQENVTTRTTAGGVP
jgi:hypothetical protein